jgi:hypothetical protein
METKHTPGPLEVHITDGGAVYVTDNHRFSDASFVVRIDSEINRNPEAMGSLFAAAPALLSACKDALQTIEQMPGVVARGPTCDGLRAAIAQAVQP